MNQGQVEKQAEKEIAFRCLPSRKYRKSHAIRLVFEHDQKTSWVFRCLCKSMVVFNGRALPGKDDAFCGQVLSTGVEEINSLDFIGWLAIGDQGSSLW